MKKQDDLIGPQAVDLYQAMALVGALKRYVLPVMPPTRGMTVNRMMAIASRFTGKKYRYGQARTAAADIQTWVDGVKPPKRSSAMIFDTYSTKETV